MTACNLRSLLVAAIVLSNCITWTASRHHFTYNVHGHRSRHRRQGAGLYLSASYITPGGEGVGEGWGEWGDTSPCSRTCGVGVAHQKRICLAIGPDGKPQCRGGDTKYFSCATQDCPSDAKDFRAEQCADFNDEEFRGVKYNWIPYTKAVNPCELNCMPRAERFYYRHKPKVIDGTRCTEDSYDVCVDGICQMVGCDMMLGSNAREDKCRECRGNGSNCVTTAGLLNSLDLVKGYNDILLIPAGSTTIVIEEIAPSNNYLALRNKNGTYYLNGHYHIDFPKSTMIAGALWNYERSQSSYAAPDKLKCMGPTIEPLYLSLLLQDENVGIQYEYSLPKNLAPYTDKQYHWVHEEFSPCNASCGGGFQSRNVTCRLKDNLEVVDDGLCDESLKPVTIQACNTDPCPAEWVEGLWSECSKHCGKDGVRHRLVTCEKIIVNGISSLVAEKECFDLHGPKPELFQECNRDAKCPTWFIGHWKACDKLCDEGKQSRQVVCYLKQNGRIKIFEDSECEGEKPATEKPCMLSICDGVDWVTAGWMGCDTCLSKVRTRLALCITEDYIVYNDSFCDYHHRPIIEEPCEDVPPCEYQWYASQWSKCSVECGEGVRTRKVFCGLYINNEVQEVEDAKCGEQPKYNDTKPCVVPDDKCPVQWYTGPWKECTKKCGGGSQSRRVMCLRGKDHDPNCLASTSPLYSQPCNTHACNADDLIPVDPLSPPIIDENCTDEDYAEVGLDEITDAKLSTLLGDDLSTADTESEFVTTDESSTVEYSTTPLIDYDYTDTSSSTDTTELDGETTRASSIGSSSTAGESSESTVITTTGSAISSSSKSESPLPESMSSGFTTSESVSTSPESSTSGSESDSTSPASSILSSESTSTESSTSSSEFSSPESSPSVSELTSSETSSSGSSTSESVSTSPESSTSGSESTSPESNTSESDSTSPASSTLGSESTSTGSSISSSEFSSPESSTSVSELTSSETSSSGSSTSESVSTSPESSTSGSESSSLGSEYTSPASSTSSSESTASKSSTSESDSTSPSSSTLGSESTSTGASISSSEFSSPESSTSVSELTSSETSSSGSITSEPVSTSPEFSTSGSESTSPESSSLGSESTAPKSSTSESDSALPASSTLGSESTSTESSTSSSEFSSPESSTSVSKLTQSETSSSVSNTSESVSTSPESSTSASESTSPKSSPLGSESTSPASSTSSLESVEPKSSTSESDSTSPASSTLGSESTLTGSNISSSEFSSPESSTSVSELTSTETTSSGPITSESVSTSPKSSTSGSESTSSESSSLGSESMAPKSSSSESESTSTESSTSSSEFSSPESSTSVSELTSPETSFSGSSTSESVSTSPESSTSASESTSTESSSLGSESTSPASSTFSSESTASKSSTSESDSTSPASSTLGSESTLTESSISSSEFSSPESSTSVSELTSSKTSYSGSSTSESVSTSPEFSTRESISPATEFSSSGSESTSPESTVSVSESSSSVPSTLESESKSPESSTPGSESTPTGSITTRLEITSPESSTSESESTSPTSSTLSSESTSPGSSTSESISSSSESSSSGSESTSLGSSTSGSESTSPESSTSESVSTLPESTTSGSESTLPESSTTGSASTSLEPSTPGSESTLPGSSTLGLESTSPESSTSESVSTSPEASTSGSESTSPESSTTGSESTLPESSTTELGSTAPESSTVELESTVETTETTSSGSFLKTESTSISTGSSEPEPTETTESSKTTGIEAGTSTSESSMTEAGGSSTEGTAYSSTDKTTERIATTPWTLITVVHGQRVCKPRKRNCNETKFGCCPDRKTAAAGPFDDGCPKPRTCMESLFGCCSDGVSAAEGNSEEGCPVTPCEETLFGCCQSDNKTAALGNDDEGCPDPCTVFKFGCCADEKTKASGENGKGCPEYQSTTEETTSEGTSTSESSTSEGSTSEGLTSKGSTSESSTSEGSTSEGSTSEGSTSESSISEGSTSEGSTSESTSKGISSSTESSTLPEGCVGSKFGCCYDNNTEASGPDMQGCPCSATEFGCCPDGVSPAQGKNNKACQGACRNSKYGCCSDDQSPAHGPDFEGCCLLTAFGCCPDNRKAAEGPHLEGCLCQHAQYGCCPDNVTAARGPNNEGCGCQYTEFGCCPDRHTVASGLDFEGCSCHTYQFGCCPDGVTIATSQQSCRCEYSTYKCCGDEKTPATGPNGAGCDCSTSKYGCCPDGQTEAAGSQFLGCANVPENKQAACSLSADPGPCNNYTVMYFYDQSYGGCSRFWYGGCEGNGNKFTTKEDCEDICVRPAPKDVCKLPDVKGPCGEDHVRWYYNSTREQCLPFRYGGCLGNDNNFDSRELCQTSCEPDKTTDTCNLAIEQGPCAGNFSRWGYNSESRACEQFIFGGCAGNTNQFKTEAACQLRCGTHNVVCSEQQEAGNCGNKVALWSFSQTENHCVPFYYNGCGGNGNRFETRESCEQFCPSVYVPDKCTLPSEAGDCGEYRLKWFYDTRIQRCRQFYYGGCGGNKNNFDTENECSNACTEPVTTTTTSTTIRPTQPQPQTEPRPQPGPEPDRGAFCFLEIDAGGLCSFAPVETRYAYNSTLGKCVTFQHNGCGGNQNNFPNKELCTNFCYPVQDICQLPMVTGTCEDSLMSWFYDPVDDSCSQFSYSGCGGNGNRFESREACESRCGTGPAVEPVTQKPTIPVNTTNTVAVDNRFADQIRPECKASTFLEECRSAGQVWYFNPRHNKCVSHVNQESGRNCRYTATFPSQETCERHCGAFQEIDVCKQRLDPGPCQDFVTKVYFDIDSNTCKEFAYSGCLGGANRFSSITECSQVCGAKITTPDICSLVPDQGSCGSYIEQWYYDADHGDCSQFVYKGCGGNDNRFDTREDCESRCKLAVTTTTTVAPVVHPEEQHECKTPSSLAPCGYNITVFYYDSNSKSCLPSEFGGCRHLNSYRSEEECERQCGAFRGKIDICQAPLDSGLCRNPVMKYYFDSLTGRCQSFTYGGCGGGPNRFSTINECEEICGESGPAPACLQEVATGYAEGCAAPALPRYYYSAWRGDCILFTYEGCGGNDNNFPSYSLCRQYCTPSGTKEVGCESYERLCASLTCDEIVRSSAPGGCESCACADTTSQCQKFHEECERTSCPYGVRKLQENGCERCICDEDPCQRNNCTEYQRCVALSLADPVTREPRYSFKCEEQEEAPPVAYPPPEPEMTAVEGDTVTLRCLFHSNPPPKITWRKGEITIDGNVGRYLVTSEGALQIASLHHNDTGVYICIADNGLGIATQQITLVVAEQEAPPVAYPPPEPEMTAVEGDTVTLRCLFHSNPPPRITWRKKEITIDGNAGRYFVTSEGALQIASLHHNDTGVYICIADNGLGIAMQQITLVVAGDETNEVTPDCSRYEAECARLNCVTGIEFMQMADGCQRCQCAPPKVDCEPYKTECNTAKCDYGMEKTVGPDGCERCSCVDPCSPSLVTCNVGERCEMVTYRDPLAEGLRYSPECRAVIKPGLCPTDEVFSNEILCEDECNDDAACRGIGKCCMRGCKKICVEPAASTLAPAILTTTHTPDVPAAPKALPQQEPKLAVAEGGKATLRCLFHSNPLPRITWRRGEITINGNVGRYRLTSEGALEIVSLYRNDTGVYICVADNGLGTAKQEINLIVTDPKDTPVEIAGDENAVITGELDKPLVVRCLAYGYPVPDVFWTRDSYMVPFNDAVYEIRGNLLYIRNLSFDTLGQYTCQAYNGIGKAASWVVLVRAYRPEGNFIEHDYLVARNGITTTRRIPLRDLETTTTSTTTTTTERPVFFTVPVSVHMATTYSTLNIGAELRLSCEVDGFPEPTVYWTKDGQRLEPDERTSITGNTISRFAISRVTVSDSGSYGCHADNGYSYHSGNAQINVQQLTVPAKCTDNPFFANCGLIVHSKFCNHKYYSKFCCKSCVEAGQLDPQVAEAQADQPYRKK